MASMTQLGDPLNFIPADILFPQVPQFDRPGDIVTVVSSKSTDSKNPLRYAAHVILAGLGQDPETHCLVQFVTPQIWRIRYNPKFTDVSQYPDQNSRIIVRDNFSDLVEGLQEEYRDSKAWNSFPTPDGWTWKTSFQQQSPGHWILSSVEHDASNPDGTTNTNLHFFQSPFRIVATRVLKPLKPIPSYLKSVGALEISDAEQVIWQTTDKAFFHQANPDIGVINNVVFNTKKPSSAAYIGFGEQGGRTVLKKPTYMNYFCYDNYNYTKVYGHGALDPKEPLYHSSPFYLEMNGTPDYKNVTGMMVDNYSQVAIDLGKGNASTVGVATRFGTFDAYIMTADNVPKMIWQYTSLVGRPKLKPRFILGHHQGCYGYDCNGDVNDVVNGYRGSGIPLDGMHIDVDFQNSYRTFTINEKNWPNPKAFLSGLKEQGVKCCTNITPIISIRPGTLPYSTLNEFWNNDENFNPAVNLMVTDNRYTDGLPNNTPLCWRYDGGYVVPTHVDPNDPNARPEFADWAGCDGAPGAPSYQDQYIFIQENRGGPEGNYNSGYPFHGGVSYGAALGTVGFYPDLNRAVARELWGKQYKYLFDMGLEFIWQDMTTPAIANCYGDMLGFPSRLRMSDDVDVQDKSVKPPTKTAIELWSLYSYNLHKATYHGLNKLKTRENKRNFIIGRGSLTGMHRYAGLWTGDNGSSWDFWKISVAQVLALGYSGLTIAGVDMGGFTADPASQDNPQFWCDPELLIRWYTGAFLLPWYRNHYNQRAGKRFQEPWRYSSVVGQYPSIPTDQYTLYNSVEPICCYYVQLRYSLLQVLYDAMFANLINGLPIARAMLITDPEDTSLFNANEDFIDRQYLLGQNILVCPILKPLVQYMDVYLPGSDLWYPLNLQVNNRNLGEDPVLRHAAQLAQPVAGGSTINYYCEIPDGISKPTQVPYVTPVYIREGAIIPQIDVRDYVEKDNLNPPTIHVYPGRQGNSTDYSMYLDDGVSRDSAPMDLPQYKYRRPDDEDDSQDVDQEAKSMYRELKITQECQESSRVIKLFHPWNGYDPSATVGETYYLAIWGADEPGPSVQVTATFQDQNGTTISNTGSPPSYNSGRNVYIIEVPVALVPSLAGDLAPGASTSNGTNGTHAANGTNGTNGTNTNGATASTTPQYLAITVTGLSSITVLN